VRDPLLTSRELIVEHYVVLAPAAWADRMLHATWEDLAGMPWLAKPPGSPQNKLIAQMFAERGLTHSSVVEADQEHTVIELIQSGVALGLMRERAALPLIQSGRLVAWHGTRLPCPLSLLYRRSSEDSLVMQALLSTLSMVWPMGPVDTPAP
jgi:DNA-binding transcriptional LysR family regulator